MHVRDFAKSEPFSAVILLDPDRANKACDLVRFAEGPRHVDLDPKRLGGVSSDKRVEFDTFLKELATRLLELAPEQTGDEWDPGFLTLDIDGTDSGPGSNVSDGNTQTAPVPPRPTDWNQHETPNPTVDPHPPNPTPNPNPFLRYGTPLKAKSTAIVKSDGLHILVVPAESAPRVELRVLKRNGADRSCDRPDPPSYLIFSQNTSLNGQVLESTRFIRDSSDAAVSLDLGSVQKDGGEIRVFSPIESEQNSSVDIELIKRQKLTIRDAVKTGGTRNNE